jgi:hypothetical protein
MVNKHGHKIKDAMDHAEMYFSGPSHTENLSSPFEIKQNHSQL